MIRYGDKGVYTIDFQAGTYRGCLKGKGCIFLGRKYFIPCKGMACENPTWEWKNGQYIYFISREYGENPRSGEVLNVSKNDRTIFTDNLRAK